MVKWKKKKRNKVCHSPTADAVTRFLNSQVTCKQQQQKKTLANAYTETPGGNYLKLLMYLCVEGVHG